ncbi:MAG: transcription factor S [Nanoarchaeota archaeon]|nr:transcription factor S [Nanoarchaeota archaeon]MBU1103030.1 transcription factor S [Nanoarchaeota archaeon]
MEFCEKCGSVILVKDGKAVCAGCGHKQKKKPKIKASEKIEKPDAVAVVNADQDDIHPQVDMKCSKCKNKKAYSWAMQTRAGDESETKFYKCVKCKHTWRVYR